MNQSVTRLKNSWFPSKASEAAGSARYVAEMIERGYCNAATVDSPSCVGPCATDLVADDKVKQLFAASAEIAKLRAELHALTAFLGTSPHSKEIFYLSLDFQGDNLTTSIPQEPIIATVNMIFSGKMFTFTMPVVFAEPIALLDGLVHAVTSAVSAPAAVLL
jgi:hypothetical protein